MSFCKIHIIIIHRQVTKVNYIVKGGRTMERKLPNWCKEAKVQMIRKDITVPELAQAIGVTRQYVSAIINGRVIAQPMVKKISDYLEISDQYDESGSV